MSEACKPVFPRSFRLVCEPEAIPHVEELLAEEGFRFEPEPFSPFCRRLAHEPIPLGSSLAAFFGYIYIQDRSAMLPPLALNPPKAAAALDMCASPGGKSGFLAQLAGKEGFVLANEPNRTRLATLRANLARCSLINVGASSQPGEKLAAGDGAWPFILLDPPCSGWGTANKNPKALSMWQGEKVDRLANLQRLLLRRAARLLAPGGLLLYSTCTTNSAENEAQTLFAENELGLERVPIAPFPGFVFEERPGGQGCLLVAGEESQAQGFYLSLLRKPGSAAKGEKPPTALLARAGGTLQAADLAGPTFDPALLPEGKLAVFGGKARFLPAASLSLPGDFAWQAPILGRFSPTGPFIPDARVRMGLPSPRPENALVLDGIGELRPLLKGQSIKTALKGKQAALWWRNLPLGRAVLKDGRLLASFR